MSARRSRYGIGLGACLALGVLDVGALDAVLVPAALGVRAATPAFVPTQPAPPPAPPPTALAAPEVALAAPEAAAAPAPLVVAFAPNAAEPSADPRPELEGLAAYLKEHASSVVTIDGHADLRGDATYNDRLGAKRAQSMASRLERLGIAPGRIRVRSFGARQPRTTGASESAFSENRRVEIRIEWSEP